MGNLSQHHPSFLFIIRDVTKNIMAHYLYSVVELVRYLYQSEAVALNLCNKNVRLGGKLLL